MINLIGCHSTQTGVPSVLVVEVHPTANALLCLVDTVVGFQIDLLIFQTAPETLDKDIRGLPLGDAVWLDASNNSGILYGDPRYSPVAVRLMPVNATDTLSGVVTLYGSAVNGRDLAQVTTSYRVDVCPGDDFFTCDQASQAWQSTGISGQGGVENALLGTLDTTLTDPGNYTLRLTVTSVHTANGRNQIFNDYYPVEVQAIALPPADPPLADRVLDPSPVASSTSAAGSGGGGGGVLRQRADGRGEDGDWSLILLCLLLVGTQTANGLRCRISCQGR